MIDSINQFFELLRAIPLSKKISIAFVFVLLAAGFALMFFWANQVSYQTLFNNLSPKDASAIVTKLRERNIPYKIEANGTLIMVPAEDVYDLRLSLAGDGLPTGGNVGFEIFDKSDFRTTKFVQELNYKRALQGELSRTINQFKRVKGSKVFLVLPKESLFIEDSKPASAAIQLDLRSSLPPEKLAAIVHLVSSAVEGLEPERVTVVDTKGNIIFKGGNGDETSGLLSSAQLDYKGKIEDQIRKSIQSMLEGIVGGGKAIVRVSAEVDFNKITLNEEEYDPTETAVRSRREILESYETTDSGDKKDLGDINQRRGVVRGVPGAQEMKTKKDVATNYEINKISRSIFKPAGKVLQLSVAAVIDGTYKTETLEDGTTQRTYTPRTEEELRKFEEIVKRAMGFNEDREDKVSVSSIPFTEVIPGGATPLEEGGLDILGVIGNYRKTIVNLVLVVLVFFLIVRPLLKSLRQVSREATPQRKELAGGEEIAQIPAANEANQKEEVLKITKEDPDKTDQLLKGWIGEGD